jgi:hypothetical protein
MADLLNELIVFIRRRGELFVFLPGTVDVSGKRRVLFDAGNDTVRRRVGGEGEYFPDAFRVTDRQVQPKDRSIPPRRLS